MLSSPGLAQAPSQTFTTHKGMQGATFTEREEGRRQKKTPASPSLLPPCSLHLLLTPSATALPLCSRPITALAPRRAPPQQSAAGWTGSAGGCRGPGCAPPRRSAPERRPSPCPAGHVGRGLVVFLNRRQLVIKWRLWPYSAACTRICEGWRPARGSTRNSTQGREAAAAALRCACQSGPPTLVLCSGSNASRASPAACKQPRPGGMSFERGG